MSKNIACGYYEQNISEAKIIYCDKCREDTKGNFTWTPLTGVRTCYMCDNQYTSKEVLKEVLKISQIKHTGSEVRENQMIELLCKKDEEIRQLKETISKMETIQPKSCGYKINEDSINELGCRSIFLNGENGNLIWEKLKNKSNKPKKQYTDLLEWWEDNRAKYSKINALYLTENTGRYVIEYDNAGSYNNSIILHYRLSFKQQIKFVKFMNKLLTDLDNKSKF